MRILEVIYSYRIGGSEIVGIEIAEQLVRAGAQVQCAAISAGDGPLRSRCEAAGIEPVDLGIPESSLLGRNGFSMALAHRLRALRPDAIHLHHMLAHNKLALPARSVGVPRIVTTEHSIATLQGNALARLRARCAWRLAHQFTAVDTGIRDYLVGEIGVSPGRISVVRNGLQLDRWHQRDRADRRRELGLDDTFTFVFVGRLEVVKNVPGLIQAFLLMQQQPSAVRSTLLIVGDGSQRGECEAVLRGQACADRVRLVGESSDARLFTAAADAFVMNSHSEGSPRAMIEAMAMGLPCLCPAVGGVVNLLQERGWLTVPGDTESLAQAMAEVASSPGLAEEAGRKGREFVYREFDSAATTREYLRLFSGA